jgi:hypothetical protein
MGGENVGTAYAFPMGMKTFWKMDGSRRARLTRNVILGAVVSLLFGGQVVRADQSISVAWNVTAGATGYYFYCGTNSSSYEYQMDAGTNTTITLTGLQEGQTNYLMVVGYNAARMLGTPSSQVTFIVPGCIRFNAVARSGNPAGLSFPVAVGHTYEVQASTNLQSWTNIWQTTTSTSNAWVYYQDPQASSFAELFYRLIMN